MDPDLEFATRHLAEFVCLLSERRSELAGLERRLVEFGVGDIPSVEGEREHASRLTPLLTKADQLIQSIASGAGPTAVLAELDALLNAGAWRLVAELNEDLVRKASEQQRTVSSLEATLREHRAAAETMRKRLDVALRTEAIVSDEGQKVVLFEDLVKQSERALGERRYLDAQALIQRLQSTANQRPLQEVVHAIDTATSAARAIAQRDELLIIGQEVEKAQWWEYTLLLRSDGGNIQDRTALRHEERERARKVADRVAINLNQSLYSRYKRDLSTLPTENQTPDMLQLSDIREDFRKVGELLYRLFIPPTVDQLLRNQKGPRLSSLVLTTNDLELPWELLHDGEEFLCLSRPFGRMVMGRALPRRKRPEPQNTKLQFLIVYSDANRQLTEAKREVEYIESALRDKWGERIVIETWTKPEQVTGERFNDALLGGRYDAIHYAGHAKFRDDDPELSGLLLPDGEVLYAQKLRRLLSGQPVVFLNACESGRSANEPDVPTTSYVGKPAEGLAAALLDGGALACIGALWPIYDEAAAQFAVSFYTFLLLGHSVGEALRLARVDSSKLHRDAATWASFALYGNPTARLAGQSE